MVMFTPKVLEDTDPSPRLSHFSEKANPEFN